MMIIVIAVTDHVKVMKIYTKTKQNYIIVIVVTIALLAAISWLAAKNVEDHQCCLCYRIVIFLSSFDWQSFKIIKIIIQQSFHEDCLMPVKSQKELQEACMKEHLIVLGDSYRLNTFMDNFIALCLEGFSKKSLLLMMMSLPYSVTVIVSIIVSFLLLYSMVQKLWMGVDIWVQVAIKRLIIASNIWSL